MGSNEEILHAVREVQMYNRQLYKYLTTGLLENSLLPQVMVEFNVRIQKILYGVFTRIDDPNIPFIKKQEAQINVFMADVRKNDKLRRGVTNIQRSLVARCNLGQPIPMVDGNMILQDFPELCVFNTSFSVPLTILCDLVLNKYNIHNQSAIMDMMRLAEEKRISRKMLNPVPIRHSQYRPIPLSDRPATVNRHPARNITLPEAETITSTPAGLITLPEADTITSTPEKLITLPVAETITSSPAGLITLPEADTITSTPAGLITLPEADTQPETITDFQAESITDTQAEPITAPQAETITETKAEFMITQTHDVTPVMSLYDASVEATANIDVNDIESSNSMDDFIKELVQPTTLCSPLHSAQADVPTNDEDTCDQLLSFLKDIPELNQDHCSLSKNSRISTAAPKCGTLSLSMQKNTMYAVPKKKDAKRDYKEYPEYTPRTDPVISWDELIVKYEKLANTNNQEQSTNQDKPSLLPEAAKHEGVSHIEEVKPAGQSQTLDVEEPPSCSQSYVVHCEQVDLGNQELPMEVTTDQCEKVKDFPSIKLLVPSPASSKEKQKPMTDEKSSNTMDGIVENKTKRKQHTPKHPTENVSERVQLLAALEKKKQKAQRILNEQYNKSWDGKIFARNKAKNVPTAEKATKSAVTTVPSKDQQSTTVNEHIGVLNKQTAKGVIQPAKVVSQPPKVMSQPAKVVSQPSKVVSQTAKVVSQQTKVVSQPAKVVSQPAKVVSQPVKVDSQSTLSQPAKVVSQPAKVMSQPARVVSQPAKVVSKQAKVVSQPTVSQSRKRPAPSSVETVMSASSAKRAREYKHRIILRIFREDSDWNVEQIVDRF